MGPSPHLADVRPVVQSSPLDLPPLSRWHARRRRSCSGRPERPL